MPMQLLALLIILCLDVLHAVDSAVTPGDSYVRDGHGSHPRLPRSAPASSHPWLLSQIDLPRFDLSPFCSLLFLPPSVIVFYKELYPVKFCHFCLQQFSGLICFRIPIVCFPGGPGSADPEFTSNAVFQMNQYSACREECERM